MRASERHHSALIQYHVVSGGRVSSAAFILFLDTKLSESANQDILTFFQVAFDQFQQGFKHFGGFVFRVSKLLMDGINYHRFCECHRSPAPPQR
jgi:hypothetical protein